MSSDDFSSRLSDEVPGAGITRCPSTLRCRRPDAGKTSSSLSAGDHLDRRFQDMAAVSAAGEFLTVVAKMSTISEMTYAWRGRRSDGQCTWHPTFGSGPLMAPSSPNGAEKIGQLLEVKRARNVLASADCKRPDSPRQKLANFLRYQTKSRFGSML